MKFSGQNIAVIASSSSQSFWGIHVVWHASHWMCFRPKELDWRELIRARG